MPTPSPNTYHLAMPEDAMYGRLGDLARAMDAPLGPAYTAVATLYSGQCINPHESGTTFVRGTLFFALMGCAGDGKSVTMDRAEAVLGYGDEHVERCMGVSERGIINIFRRGLKREEEPTGLSSAPLTIDEMVAFMCKMNIQNSTLQQTMNSMFYKDNVSVADKMGTCAMKARVSLLGCLKVDDADEFRERFAGRSQDGFADRLILAPLPQNWPWDFTWRPVVPQVKTPIDDMADVIDEYMGREPAPFAPWGPPQLLLPKRPVAFPSALRARAAEWDRKQKADGFSPGRIKEIAERVALVTASANGDKQVTEECLAAALRFADWQLAVRQEYSPSNALTDDAVIYDRVQAAIQGATDAHRAGEPWVLTIRGKQMPVTKVENRFIWVSIRNVTQHKNLNRVATKYGGQKVSHMVQALANLGLIEYEKEGGDKMAVPQRTGYVRIANDPPFGKAEKEPAETATEETTEKPFAAFRRKRKEAA